MSLSHASVVIIDTDVGYDDVLAISMLLAADIPIAGVTTVNGLAHAWQGAKNLLHLLDRIGRREIPVAVGANEPLVGNHSFKAPWREEADALPGITLPPTDLQPVSSSAAEFLVNTVGKHPGKVTLLCLGPLTNIALALRIGSKAFVKGVRKLVMMGGAIHVPGNGTPNEVSEWNLYVDSLAGAHIVRSGIPITMIGLDITNQAPVTMELVEALSGEETHSLIGCLMQEAVRRMYSYLYDPMAAAYILDPSLIQTIRIPIRVVAKGSNAGQTIEDPWGTPIHVAVTLEQSSFRRLLIELIYGK